MHDKYRLEDKEGPLYFSRQERLGYSTCIVKRDRWFFIRGRAGFVMVRLQGISPGTGYLWLNRFFITSIIKQMD
jgi:hypothetical protein